MAEFFQKLNLMYKSTQSLYSSKVGRHGGRACRKSVESEGSNTCDEVGGEHELNLPESTPFTVETAHLIASLTLPFEV